MNTDVGHWLPDDEALKYISDKTGKSIEELEKEKANNLNQLQVDVAFLNNNRIFRKYDDISVNVKQEEPIKVADIVLHCEDDGKVYDITLTNCIQTNRTWVLGDHIKASGPGVEDIIAATKKEEEERAEKRENSGLAKLQKKAEEAEAKEKAEAESKGKRYVGEKFRLQSGKPHSVYYRMQHIGKKVDGYYVTKDMEKHEGKILYQAPEIMHDQNKYLVTYDEHGTKKNWSKGEIEAFYVAGQLYIFTGEFWDIMIEEGAIRRLGRVVKNSSTGEYVTADLIQKVGISPENTASLAFGFKNKMSELVEENKELSKKVKNREKGYRLMQMDDIIDEYNQWYDEEGPADIEYLAERVEAAKSKDSENSVGIDKDKKVQVLTSEDLADYLSNKTWEVTKLTQFDKANPDGVTKSSGLKSARLYFTHSFGSNGTVLIEGNSPYKGKYDKWKVSGRNKITLINSANNKESVYTISETKSGVFKAERTNPLMKNKEIITFSLKGKYVPEKSTGSTDNKDSNQGEAPLKLSVKIGKSAFGTPTESLLVENTSDNEVMNFVYHKKYLDANGNVIKETDVTMNKSNFSLLFTPKPAGENGGFEPGYKGAGNAMSINGWSKEDLDKLESVEVNFKKSF